MDLKVLVACTLLFFLFLVPESKTTSRQNGGNSAENQDFYNALMDIINVDEELNKSYTGIMWQACWAAGGSLLGFYVRGRNGALIGAICGGFIGYFTSDTYEPVPLIIMKMTHEQKMQLVTKVRKLLGKIVLNEYVATEANRALFRKLIVDIVIGIIRGQ